MIRRRARQEHAHGRAPAGGGLDVNLAAMLSDDAVHGGQSESRAAPHALGGEERLENSLADFVIHAMPGVADEHLHMRARRKRGASADEIDVAGANGEHAVRAHGVTGV